ncbi:MAG: MFS transporter [Sulfolobales archaeon]
MKFVKTQYYSALLATTSASFLIPFTASSIALALPTLSEEFNLNLAEVNWVANIFLIALSSLVLIIGRVSDWLGKGKVFLSGVTLFTISSFITFFTYNYADLLVCRFVQGVSASMISSTAIPILVDVFPKEKRGLGIGVNTMAIYVGSSLGPLIGGYIINHFGWRTLFVFKALIATIALIFTLLVIDLRRGIASKPSSVKTILIPFSIALIVYGASSISTLLGLLSISSGMMLFISILVDERKNPKLLHPTILNRRPIAANTSALLNYSATYALTIILSTYLQKIRDLQPADAGLILAIQPITQATLSPIAGYLADRRDPSTTASIGMFIIATSIGGLLLITRESPLVNLLVILAILGVGFALFASSNTTAIMNMSSREAYGSATALLATMRFVGQALSTSIITSIMRLENDLFIAMKSSLMIYIVLSILGALLSLIARDGKEN